MNIQKINRTIIGLSFILIMLGVSYQPITSVDTKINANELPMDGIQILILLEDTFDTSEYYGAKDPLEQFGCNITLAGPRETISTGTETFPVDLLLSEVDVNDYDCLYIPGGLAPEKLILIPEFITLIQQADALELCLAAICSGPLAFAAADIVSDRNVTSNPSVKAELVAAGGNYFDDAHCIRHEHLVSADSPYMLLMVIEMVKALGFYETNPPEILSMDYDLTKSGSNYNFYLEIEATDEFEAKFFRLENGGSTKNLVKSPYLQDPEDDGIYNYTILGLDPGDYVIELSVQDLLANIYTNTTFLSFTLEDTDKASIGFNW
ncbi:MAG: DJ-1/PfpI family protein [Candidatus Heimdallarchaeota archaeon]